MNILIKLSREENISYYNANEIEIDIEEYLKGVIPAEIGNAHIEACAAQAVAARTYALRRIKAKGYITDQSTIDQAFRASRFEGYPNAYAGVEKTRGQLLYYNNSLARCYYSNSNGGRTTSGKDYWNEDYPYLIAQDDPYDNGSGNGHGVGLSQVGAKNRAEAGQSYKEILAFYYPGTRVEGEETSKVYETLYQAKVSSTTAKLNLREGPSKDTASILQIPPQGIMDVLEESITDWWLVRYNSETGYVMRQYIEKINKVEPIPEPAKEYYVKIKCESAEEAKRLVELLGAAATYE